MATLAEIARKAGVSTMTASLVLNKESIGSRVSSDCAARVRGIAEQMGYTPNYHARSMKRGRADALAIAVDVNRSEGPDRLDNQLILPIPYFSRIIGAFEQDAREHGMQATIIGPIGKERAPDRAFAGVRQRRFDGMAVLGAVVHPTETSFMTGLPAGPVVSIHYPEPTQIPNILPDESAAVALAVDHLANMGHRHVLYIGEPPQSWQRHHHLRERLAVKALQSAGMICHVCPQQPPPETNSGYVVYQNDAELAQRAVAQLLANRPRTFTAVIAYNDRVAVGACNALQDAGLRIPQDVSVMGFDNCEGRFYRPAITSVDMQFVRTGRRASQLLLELLANPARQADLWGHVEYIPPIFAPGGSTGPVSPVAT